MWWIIFRGFSEPGLGKFDVGVSHGGGTGVVRRVELRLIAGFENTFAAATAVREFSSVEPAVKIGFVGIVIWRQNRYSLRHDASMFGKGVR